jgi:hypothetical protein
LLSQQGITLEQLLVYVERAVQSDRRLLVQLIREMQQLAHHPTAPPEEQAVGEVLSRVLMGDRNPDLSHLPPDIADEVQQMLDRMRARAGKGQTG